MAKRAAAGEARAQKSLGSAAGMLANTELKNANSTANAITSAAPRRTDVGTVAAIGVALGSISAVLVGIFGKFVDLGVWIPLALAGIVLAISGPSMLIAWLKLRQRSLGPLLDASGWAINGRMRVNTRLGGSLSQTAKVPATARRTLKDPFSDSRAPLWWTLGLLAVVIALAIASWRLHWLDTWLARSAPGAGATATQPGNPTNANGPAQPATATPPVISPAVAAAAPATSPASAASAAR